MTGNIRQAIGLVVIAAALLLVGFGMGDEGETLRGVGTLVGVMGLGWLAVILLKPTSTND